MTSAWVRIAAVAAAAVLLLATAVFTPLALRQLGGFAVRRVELVGARHLTGQAAIAAAGITRGSNVFDDPAPWLQGLHAHPLVVSARIERKLPATLMVHVVEAVPVAFARTPELRAIDEHGRILPANPADDEMDLPVLSVSTRVSADGVAVDPQTRRITKFLGIVAVAEPGLLGWVSEIGVSADAVQLVLRNATAAEVLLPAQPTAERLRELHIMLAELATPRAGEPALSDVRRIDVRFRDQIVVALHGRES